MSDLNIKDFLNCGAFLQIGAELFKVLVGPFARHDFSELGHLNHSTLLYKPNFWDFLDKHPQFPQKPIYSAQQAYTLDREEFIHLLAKVESGVEAQKPEINWRNPSQTQFKAQFDWSQNNFREQKLAKTVPIIRQQGDVFFSLQNLLWCMQNMMQDKIFGWSYGFFERGQGILGHTPEILAQWTRAGQQLHTVALAGTYANSKNAYNEIQQDKKVWHEHQMVIDDIKDKLNSLGFAAKTIQGPTDILELKYLLHLLTEFQIEIGNREQVFEVINVLHPTSAMGLYPADLTKLQEFSEFSLQQERGSFAAPFAIIEKEALYCVVAIRNMLFAKEQVALFSGCGVTAESQYELELAESQHKRDSVKKMLGLYID